MNLGPACSTVNTVLDNADGTIKQANDLLNTFNVNIHVKPVCNAWKASSFKLATSQLAEPVSTNTLTE